MATMTQIIDGLAALAGRYDVLLCDVWGVIHNGVASYPAACQALARWRSEVGPVVLITNAPRPEANVAEMLDRLVVPREAWSAIATSGDVSRGLLAGRAPGPAFRIGPAKDDPLFAGLGLAWSGPEDAAFVACSGPNDETTETPDDYRDVLSVAAARRLPMICANPDIVVQRGETLIYCAGALARLYEELGGEVIQAGKPFAPIYDLALAKAGGPERARVLAVGDGLATDLKGARDQGLDALFVADGVHAVEVAGAGGRFDPQALARLTAPHPPRFGIERLVW
jgi:HAD superfamily hydrolase (TIGR01450 family)